MKAKLLEQPQALAFIRGRVRPKVDQGADTPGIQNMFYELTTDEASCVRPVPGGPENLITANGPTVADKEVSLRLGSCKASATALVLDDSPSVLSLGRLIEEGFSFFHTFLK